MHKTKTADDTSQIESFEYQVEEKVKRRVNESGICEGEVRLHKTAGSPTVITQDLSDDAAEVGYTVGAKTCTMATLWGTLPDNKRLLAVFHQSGAEELYAGISKLMMNLSAKGFTAVRMSYARGELGHMFGTLDEERIKTCLESNVSEDFTIKQLPTREKPVAYGLIAEAKTGKTITY